MVQESDLSSITSIKNTDFFRIVTDSNLSRKATGEVLKAFIGADTITKVNDFYYFQDADNPEDNDYRIFSNGIYLDFERYETNTWVRQFRIGGSAFVERFLDIARDGNADILVSDGDAVRNLVRCATWSSGSVLGDIDGDTFIVTEDKIRKVRRIEAESWKVIQGDDTQNSTGTSFYIENTTADVDGFIAEKVRVSGVSLPSDVKAQLKVFRQSDLSNEVWKNVTDIELQEGDGAQVDQATGEIFLKPRFYGIGNEAIRLEFNFDQEITLKGSNSSGTNIYLESFEANVAFEEIESANLGEVKMFALSLTDSITKADLIEKGWAVCDGTTPVSQGITDPTIITTPNLQDKFIRMSNNETSGTTGGVDTNSITWASRSVDDNGTTVVGTVEGTTSGTKVFDNKPPFYELVFFIKVK